MVVQAPLPWCDLGAPDTRINESYSKLGPSASGIDMLLAVPGNIQFFLLADRITVGDFTPLEPDDPDHGYGGGS
jgi:hypothetical protein